MARPAVALDQPVPAALPKKRIRWGEQFVHLLLFLAAAISVLTTLGIVISLILPAIDFFREVSLVGVPDRDDLGAALPGRGVRRRAARQSGRS